ncbi:MAG: cytidine deaminase [Streblomastix strix]|uniref:Cytidine deaminase n=1 Tax=Streblomastix strix TaxID=222440 RepID=A0A5J4X6W6_9EUKA|nr:MAG: cytidine deaminase [Streblomastix strix]
MSEKHSDVAHAISVDLIKALLSPCERDNPPFFFAAQKVKEMQDKLNCSQSELMLGLAFLAQPYAVCPISQFAVGACVLGISGNAYLGVNVEFLRTQLNQTVHAEQCAITNAWNNMEKDIVLIATTETPCGYCRQFMSELPSFNTFQVVVEGRKQVLLRDLISDAFRPSALHIDQTQENMSLFQYRNDDAFLHLDRYWKDSNVEDKDAKEQLNELKDIVQIIFERSFKRSYSPFLLTKRSPSSIGILVRKELVEQTFIPRSKQPSSSSSSSTSSSSSSFHVLHRLFSGALIENVSFNPSIQPFQSSVISMICGNSEYQVIKRNRQERIDEEEQQQEQQEEQEDVIIRRNIRELLHNGMNWDDIIDNIILIEDYDASITIQREFIAGISHNIAPHAKYAYLND